MTRHRFPVAVALALSLLLAGCDNGKPTAFQGWIEADLIFVGPDEAGRVETLAVREGDEVAAADQGGAPGISPPGEGVAERTVPQNQRLIAERQAIEALTSKERSIIRLITEGKSSLEAAELMHLSPRTVETYRSRLMEKLQLEDLVALVKFAIRNGMSSVD